ncbi:hypothetical protein GGU11DRAFT_742748 [Lentinula aff. detonsa]|uniref:Uncharacterized protein n=1 Tax=Lentinula aff. detonsa TaxID=2804958 RepID=A0AA38NMT3_9AGAR|nr:hypothetical protein GGU10DRAFT_374288 [Lentinula aff. detonsa]KAJ3800209.1 hypothetical protein GGU11DRAFT_742748 [Lentinula aff. detonsa]
MASSVSRDIVEGLQVVKCALRRELIMREPAPSLHLEEQLPEPSNLEEIEVQQEQRNPVEEDEPIFEVDLGSDSEE